MQRNSASRKARLLVVFAWMSILGLLVYPAHTVFAQGDGRLFLPLVNTRENGQNQAVSDLVVAKHISQASQKAALEFWTHEQLAAATPLEITAVMGPMTEEEATGAAAEVSGPPGFAPAGQAAPDAASVAQAAYPEDWQALAEVAGLDTIDATDGTSQVFTRYAINSISALWKIYPHIWTGRLSFSTPGGTSYCTGTSISNNIMLTAAHCLYDSTNNQWFSNWVFTPAYRNGNAPYGTFAATNCWVLTSWINLTGSFAINSWSQHDVGVCNMGTNSAGTTLNNAVGWMGRQWDWPYVRHFHILGYPFRDYNDAVIPNAGLYLQTCVSESFQQTTETRGSGCDRSRGMSGGPWMVGYAPTLVAGAADGVSSGFFAGTQNLYGARFNSSNIVVLCSAAGC